MYMLMRRRLREADIAAMHNNSVCGYYAIINLWKMYGLEPPSFEAMFVTMSAYVANNPNAYVGRSPLELTMQDVLSLLTDFNFPALCTVAAMPRGKSAQDIL